MSRARKLEGSRPLREFLTLRVIRGRNLNPHPSRTPDFGLSKFKPSIGVGGAFGARCTVVAPIIVDELVTHSGTRLDPDIDRGLGLRQLKTRAGVGSGLLIPMRCKVDKD